MPISRRTYANVCEQRDAQTARLETAREEREKTARAMARIAVQYDALKTIVARHIVATGATSLSDAAARAGVDLRIELDQAAKQVTR
jgi:hypothetical protein